ncbi:hypothetical protein HK105_202892 [Polyrhizophydium stewartii]|uniref:Cyclic nucleotide-binding domain-containing protein n=1 Tax=Polyrhizophydium stewartii TaxID=2732419 RepID=A0ABR4NDL9_9FUNG
MSTSDPRASIASKRSTNFAAPSGLAVRRKSAISSDDTSILQNLPDSVGKDVTKALKASNAIHRAATARHSVLRSSVASKSAGNDDWSDDSDSTFHFASGLVAPRASYAVRGLEDTPSSSGSMQNSNRRVSVLRTKGLRWRKVYHTQRIQVLLLIWFRDIATSLKIAVRMMPDSNPQPEPDPDDVSASEKLRTLISMRDLNQSNASLTAMEVLLASRLPSFRRFTLPQRTKFCEVLKGKVIVFEGHVSSAFYFILSGKVEIFKGRDDTKIRLNVMGKGTSFGDRTMSVLNDKLTASVATIEMTELLQIDKRDFMSIAQSGSSKEMAAHAEKIRQLKDFATVASEVIDKMLMYGQFLTLESQYTLATQGNKTPQMFWIFSGVCKCLRTVQFLKKHSINPEGGQLTIYSPGTPVERSDEIVSEVLGVGDLSSGDYFPCLRKPKQCQIVRSVAGEPVSFDRLECARTWLEDPKHVSPVTVVTGSRVEIMMISQSEFVEIAPLDVLLRMFENQSVMDRPVRELQEAFLQKLQWEQYKRRVKDEVLGRKKSMK